jgi:hypothetical protein
VALAEDLEEKFGASLGQWHIAELVDDEELDSGELGLKFEQTLFVARFHQLMDEPNRRRKGDGKAALAGGEAERQARMRLSCAAVARRLSDAARLLQNVDGSEPATHKPGGLVSNDLELEGRSSKRDPALR